MFQNELNYEIPEDDGYFAEKEVKVIHEYIEMDTRTPEEKKAQAEVLQRAANFNPLANSKKLGSTDETIKAYKKEQKKKARVREMVNAETDSLFKEAGLRDDASLGLYSIPEMMDTICHESISVDDEPLVMMMAASGVSFNDISNQLNLGITAELKSQEELDAEYSDTKDNEQD